MYNFVLNYYVFLSDRNCGRWSKLSRTPSLPHRFEMIIMTSINIYLLYILRTLNNNDTNWIWFTHVIKYWLYDDNIQIAWLLLYQNNIYNQTSNTYKSQYAIRIFRNTIGRSQNISNEQFESFEIV